MSELKFSEDHEWILVDGDVGTVGITEFAQEQLGDVVFVEVPDEGKDLEKGDEAAVVESVKAASEVYAICDGEVIAGNEALADEPSLVNSDPMGEGWFYKAKITDASQLEQLMDEAGYKAFIEGQG
ncbi:glycine cleavage system protein H [Kiloniella litopenaei]|uniref:Glycine cleavage system H protein n=1 Tax=Kiloniella litopenaei TaxID=1549748 RepID=A0A0M2R7A3_9PROT|nr:glycine cleavage system protein GcvH [Kiloniella litopenaei]KKJ77757.1 glycine cleavage system protein H [Kiloniella litopenaei]